MQSKGEQVPSHESVDHDEPTDAGLMDDDEVPGTGIMGDETVVRTKPEVEQPGIAPGTVNDRDADQDSPTSPPLTPPSF